MSLRETLTKRLAERRALRDEARAKRKEWLERLKRRQTRVDNTRERLENLPPAVNALWHPDAKRVIEQDSGPFRLTNVPPRLVWHTTEGTSLPNYTGTAPHFTFNPRVGELWQHIPLNRCAMALMHPSGTVETNHARAIQVELIGFASSTQNWSDADYARIAELARWIERNAGVQRKCSVTFTGAGVTPKRMSSAQWLAYDGHCGHQHVPSNLHWDPGKLRIEKIL